MRIKLTFLACAAAIGALTVGVVTSAAADAPKGSKVTCNFKLNSQAPPQALTGYDLGFASCPGSFGDGLQWDEFTVTPAPPNVTVRGPFKDFFNRGTIHGSYELHATLTGTTASGTFKILGGTGAFEHVRGHGRLECVTVSSTQNTCTGTIELTRS